MPVKLPAGRESKGYIVALITAAFLSTTAIFIRQLTLVYHLPALVLAFWRDVIVTITLLPFLFFNRGKLLAYPAHSRGFLALYSLVLACFNALWTLSVSKNGAAAATVLVYCSAAFTALLARWLLKESLNWAKWTAVVVCLAGCVLVSGAVTAEAWRGDLLGIFAGVLSGLSYAGYSLMGRAASQRGLNPWTTLFYTFAGASLVLLVFNFFGFLPGAALGAAPDIASGLFWLGASWQGWLVLVLLAAVPTVAGFGLLNVTLTMLPSSTTNLILTIEPVFTAAIAFVLLGEHLTAVQWVGSLVILAGVVFLRIYELYGYKPVAVVLD
jgi:drug/metabolite transporter (DMT)-like permease